jgi:uncharacterized protein (TIGR02421 family)
MGAFSNRDRAGFRQTVRALSDRLVQAQRSLRLLEAIRWNGEIERDFLRHAGRELPAISREYYRSRPLPFDPDAKSQELLDLERDVRRRLGEADPPGQILLRMSEEYRRIVWMLERRGTPDFAKMSAELYGSALDSWRPGSLPLARVVRSLSAHLDHAVAKTESPAVERTYDARQAGELLARRLTAYFRPSARFRIRVGNGIPANAAAGSGYIKLRGDARFTLRDIRFLEVHEGWVHLGTTVNGMNQPICTFLGKGSPSSTITQEGLAVLTEVLSSAAYPHRLRQLCRRLEAVARAEDGADFRDIYRFFVSLGEESGDAYHHTVRVFRGSLPIGCGPFTKDICYTKGFLVLLDHLDGTSCPSARDEASALFCGKIALGDAPAIVQLIAKGLVAPPQFLPPPFASASKLDWRLRKMKSLVDYAASPRSVSMAS